MGSLVFNYLPGAESVLVASIAAAALVAIIIARRGRQIDDHPHCRRCGFDLFMKSAEADRCAECGASLMARKAVFVGLRQSHLRLLRAGLLVLSLCSVDAGVHGYRRASTTDWNPYKPLWWLKHEAERGSAATSDAALVELARRVPLGKIPSADEAALVSEALVRQADLKRPWIAGWGDVVQAVHAARRLNEKLWDQYELNAVELNLEPAAPTMRTCDPVAFHVVRGPDRIGHAEIDMADDFDFVTIVFFNHKVKVDAETRHAEFEQFISWRQLDQPLNEGDLEASSDMHGFFDYRDGIGDTPILLSMTPEISPGRKHTELTFVLRPASRKAQGGARAAVMLDGARTVALACDWQMAPSPRLVQDPALHQGVLNSLKLSSLHVQSTGWKYSYTGYTADFVLECTDPPIDLAFDLFVDDPTGGNRYGVETMYAPRGKTVRITRQVTLGFPKTGVPPADLKLMLAPSAHASAVGSTDVWNDWAVFENLTDSKFPRVAATPKSHW